MAPEGLNPAGLVIIGLLVNVLFILPPITPASLYMLPRPSQASVNLSQEKVELDKKWPRTQVSITAQAPNYSRANNYSTPFQIWALKTEKMQIMTNKWKGMLACSLKGALLNLNSWITRRRCSAEPSILHSLISITTSIDDTKNRRTIIVVKLKTNRSRSLDDHAQCEGILSKLELNSFKCRNTQFVGLPCSCSFSIYSWGGLMNKHSKGCVRYKYRKKERVLACGSSLADPDW